jgi:hypothetical protein
MTDKPIPPAFGYAYAPTGEPVVVSTVFTTMLGAMVNALHVEAGFTPTEDMGAEQITVAFYEHLGGMGEIEEVTITRRVRPSPKATSLKFV